jgi:hypothetical protein
MTSEEQTKLNETSLKVVDLIPNDGISEANVVPMKKSVAASRYDILPVRSSNSSGEELLELHTAGNESISRPTSSVSECDYKEGANYSKMDTPASEYTNGEVSTAIPKYMIPI